MKNSFHRQLVALATALFASACSNSQATAAPQAAAPAPVVVVAPPQTQPKDPSVVGKFPELTSPSPAASAAQRVGLTDIRVEYSSPGVKGRKIFGELVPFDKPWRVGANGPTRVEFSRDVSIDGTPVAAGQYSIFTVPGAESWTIILNADPEQKGVFEHDEKLDVVRVQAKPTVISPRERMTFVFANTTKRGVDLTLEWDTIAVALPIKIDTDAHVAQSIKETLEQAWRPSYNVARHYASTGKTDEAIALFEQSIAIHPSYWNHFFLATTLKEKGDSAGAKEHAAVALKLGEGAPVFERAFKERAEAIAQGGGDS